MIKRERLQAALAGEPVDRPPISLWRHFPDQDGTAEGLAEAVIDFQREFDFDFVKVTHASGYAVEDWGAEFVYRGNEHGTRDYVRRVVSEREDWRRLEPLLADEGVYGEQVRCMRLLHDEFADEVLFVPTIFSPLTIANNLAGEERFSEHLRAYPDDLHAALDVVASTTANLTAACLEAGAHGIFFATQMASTQKMTKEEYDAFGVPYDRQVLDAAGGSADFILLHIHGEEILFEKLVEYPVDAVNWHDRRAWPALEEAKELFGGCVVGGINEEQVLKSGSPGAVRAQVRDAIEQTEGIRHIVGAGCVTPIVTPEENIRAAREAVEG